MHNRTRVKVAAAAMSAGLVLAGCAAAEEEQAPTPAAPAVEEITYKIGFISHTQDVTDLFGQMKIAFEATLQAEGIKYELTAGAPPKSDNHEAMDRILTDLLTVAPDYMVMGPSSYDLNEPRLVDLEVAGTKIVMTDYAPDLDTVLIDPLTWVVYSHGEMGKIAGVEVAKQACESEKDVIEIALFKGPAASEISENRGLGILEGLEETFAACGKDYEIVSEVFADFNLEKAYALMTDVRTLHPNLDIAFGYNSNTALGMSQSLVASNRLEGLKVITMGGTPNELAALCRGEINNSVFRDPVDMGVLAAQAIINDIRGTSSDTPNISFTTLAAINSCQDVFDTVQLSVLEQESFKGAIDAEMWTKYTG